MTSVPSASAADASSERRRSRRPARKPWPAWVHLILALVLVAVLRNFIAQSFYVPSGSMIPTLQVGDRMIVPKFGQTIEHGDIVVFDGTETFGGNPAPRFDSAIGKVVSGVGKVFGVDVNERDYVKRVIGMGGDHVVCCDANEAITDVAQVVDRDGRRVEGARQRDRPQRLVHPLVDRDDAVVAAQVALLLGPGVRGIRPAREHDRRDDHQGQQP